MKEFPISQVVSEPARRHFADSEHFDLLVWYEDSRFRKITGFQLGYKENPFNIDDEYFLSMIPTGYSVMMDANSNSDHDAAMDLGGSPSIKAGTTRQAGDSFPATKIIYPTRTKPPASMALLLDKALSELPADIRDFLKVYVKP